MLSINRIIRRADYEGWESAMMRWHIGLTWHVQCSLPLSLDLINQFVGCDAFNGSPQLLPSRS